MIIIILLIVRILSMRAHYVYIVIEFKKLTFGIYLRYDRLTMRYVA